MKQPVHSVRALARLALCILAVLLTGCLSPSPSDIAEKLYKSLESGEIEDASELFSSKTVESLGVEKLRTGLRQMTREIADKGGIKKFKITGVEEIGEIAEVSLEVEYGNGEKESDKLQLVKEDGDWKIEPSK